MFSSTLRFEAVGQLTTAVRPYAIPALLGYVVLRAFYLLWLHPLADVPGPKLATLTDLWKTRAVVKQQFSTALHEQHAKHGDVVRIGPNEVETQLFKSECATIILIPDFQVSIISPDDVKSVYGVKTGFTNGPFYEPWSVKRKEPILRS